MNLADLNIAVVYVNLASRQDRREEVEYQVQRMGWKAIRQPGIRGQDVRDPWGYQNARRYACSLAKRLAIRRGLSTGADAVLLLEDDVVFDDKAQQRLGALELPEDWAMLYLGGRHLQRPVPVGRQGLIRLRETADNHAVLIRARHGRAVMRALAGSGRGAAPSILYSDVKLALLQQTLPCFGVYPNIAWQAVSFSENGQRIQSHYDSNGRQTSPTGPVQGLEEEIRNVEEPESDVTPKWDFLLHIPQRRRLEETFPMMVCVNLGRRGDRREKCARQFRSQHLNVERWSAVDARDLTNWRGHQGPGQYGCALSHRLILREAKRRRVPAVLIFEDDVVLRPDFRSIAEAVSMPDNWGLFYYGCQHVAPPTVCGPGLVRPSRALSTHAYAVKAPWFDRVMSTMRLGVADSGVRECDVALANLQARIPSYAVFPNLAGQDEGASDIVGAHRKPYQEDGTQSWNRHHLKRANARMHTLTSKFKEGIVEAHCPVCGFNADLLPFGEPQRAGAQCQRCGSLERHRSMALFLRSPDCPFRADSRLLHFAPELGLRKLIQARFPAAYVAVDLHAGEGVEREDVQSLSFPDSAFDAVVCSHVLEHVPDDRLAMRELYRVLQPRGTALIMVPVREDMPTYENAALTTEEERRVHFGQKDHARWYGMDVVARLREAGFLVEVVNMYHRLGPEGAARYGLMDEPIFLCRK
jgi:GR25 family glycosyltransferase involved in LPS biosynthesis/SAM-dependent methyltransferase